MNIAVAVLILLTACPSSVLTAEEERRLDFSVDPRIELLAAVQILLYTGGVLTLVVFVIVMTAQTDDSRRWRKPLWALLFSVAVFVILAFHAGDVAGPPQIGGLETGKETGVSVFRTYIVPFELLSVLLLAAIFGALVIARKEGDS